MSIRKLRVASTIQKELAEIIMRELRDPRLTGLPSITRVKVADDLTTAEVFITVMGTPGQQNAALNALKHSAGLMRTKLTKAMTLKQAPFLSFKLDEDLKKELELDALMKKIEEENRELDRRRAAEEAAAAAADPAPGDSPAPPPQAEPGPDTPRAQPRPDGQGEQA